MGKTTATTIATADHVQVLPAQLVDSVAQLDDSGANTAERYDWQAAMAASDGLALYFDAMGDDGRVRLDSQDEVLCEWHEDYVLKRKDSVVLVSASTGIRELAPTPPGRAVPDACAPADRHGRDVHAGAVAAPIQGSGRAGHCAQGRAGRSGNGTHLPAQGSRALRDLSAEDAGGDDPGGCLLPLHSPHDGSGLGPARRSRETVNLREERVVQALNGWIGQLFDPDNVDATVAALLDSRWAGATPAGRKWRSVG